MEHRRCRGLSEGGPQSRYRRHGNHGGGDHAVELADDRRRSHGHRHLPQRPASADGFAAGSGFRLRSDDRRQRRDLCRRMFGLPRHGRQRRPYLFPSLAGSSNVRSTDPASLIRVRPRGRAQRCNRRRADQAGNAVVRMEAERRSTRHGPHLYPQLLGFVRAGGRPARGRTNPCARRDGVWTIVAFTSRSRAPSLRRIAE